MPQSRSGNYERGCYIYDKTRVQFAGLAGELVLPTEQAADAALPQLARRPYIAISLDAVGPTSRPRSTRGRASNGHDAPARVARAIAGSQREPKRSAGHHRHAQGPE